MNYELHITQTSGETQVHALTSAEVTIGSDRSSDICLVGEAKLLSQHILIAPQRDQCWISTASGAPLWDQEGQPVQGNFVPWGTRLSLGSCRFHLQATEFAEEIERVRNPQPPTADKPNESTKTSPLFLMLLVSALAFAGLQLLHGPVTSATALPPDAPQLFDELETCKSKNALHRAALAEEEAFAKNERSVFERQDGISAVYLFAEADACYRAAKHKAEAEAVGHHGKQLRQALEEEYKLLRMRLARALNNGDSPLALAQLRQLLALLEHRSDSDYVLGLRRLDLHLSKEQLP